MFFSNLLRQALEDQIIGQEQAVLALTRVVALAVAGRSHPNRPLAALLFVGPTGSGKTTAAQALARVLLGDESRMVFIEGRPFGDLVDAERHLHDQLRAGFASALAAGHRASIILFDDVDKAPPEIRNELAAGIGRGEILVRGTRFPLANCFIICACTLSKRKMEQIAGRTVGFSPETATMLEIPRYQAIALEEMDALVGERLVRRLDEIVPFTPIGERDVVRLLDREVVQIERALAASSIGLIIDAGAKAFLLRLGLVDLNHGFRQIKRAIRNYLEFPLADVAMSHRLVPGTAVFVTHELPQSHLSFRVAIPRLAASDGALLGPQLHPIPLA
jgi:ATP-dependent Clp protease ATP-binding subunit ClpC